MRPDFEELDDDELRRFVESTLFRKWYAYRSLTDGIEALKEDDALYESLVEGVKRRQGRVNSRETIEEVLDALVAEVEDNTEVLEPVGDEEESEEYTGPLGEYDA